MTEPRLRRRLAAIMAADVVQCGLETQRKITIATNT